jgi:hypothetical protein
MASHPQFGSPLADPVHRFFQVRSFALRTAAGAVKPLPVLKDVSATQTAEGFHNELLSLACDGACDVKKVFIDFSLPDARSPRDLSCAHLLFT